MTFMRTQSSAGAAVLPSGHSRVVCGGDIPQEWPEQRRKFPPDVAESQVSRGSCGIPQRKRRHLPDGRKRRLRLR